MRLSYVLNLFSLFTFLRDFCAHETEPTIQPGAEAREYRNMRTFFTVCYLCARCDSFHTPHILPHKSAPQAATLAATALHRVGRAKTAQSKQGANANASLTSSVGAQQRDRRVVEVRGDAAGLPKQVVVVGMQCYGQVGGGCMRRRNTPAP